MTIDDGTAITLGCGAIAALAGAVAWLWKAMDRRYQAELARRDKDAAKRDAEIADLTARVRKLEDDRVPTQVNHAAKIEALTNRADATENRVAETLTALAKAVREIAANVNAQTEAIKGIRCKTFNQDVLPEPHPASAGTDTIIAKNRVHA